MVALRPVSYARAWSSRIRARRSRPNRIASIGLPRRTAITERM